MVHKIYFRLEQTAWLLYYILIRKNEGYPLSSYLPRMHPYNPTIRSRVAVINDIISAGYRDAL